MLVFTAAIQQQLSLTHKRIIEMAKDEALKKEVKTVKPAKVADKKESKEKGEFGAKRKYAESTKIKVLNKENPHREGSGRAVAFEALKTCKNVGDYYETGHKTKYLGDWVASGHLEEIGQG